MSNVHGASPLRLPFIAVSALVLLMVGAGSVLGGVGQPSNGADTPCDVLLAGLSSTDRSVGKLIADFGLPAEVQVAGGLAIGNVYCWERYGEDRAGFVDAVAVFNVTGDQGWLVLTKYLADPDEIDWRDMLNVLGLSRVVKTDYGFASVQDQAPTADLWTQVVAARSDS